MDAALLAVDSIFILLHFSSVATAQVIVKVSSMCFSDSTTLQWWWVVSI